MDSVPVSPTKESSPIPSSQPQELTPRSKVKALLAQFDDSDSDTSPIVTTRPINEARPELSRSSDETRDASASPSSSDSDSEPVEKRPIGRLASRMKGISERRSSRTPSKSPSIRTATPSISSPKQTINKLASSPIVGSNEQIDVDASVPPQSSRLNTPQHNRVTSRSSSLPQSPSLFVSPGDGRSPSKGIPSRSSSASVSDSDDSVSMLNTTNQKLKDLVAKRKAERRKEKQALKEQAKERQARAEKIASDAADLEQIMESESDSVESKKIRKSLTQNSRPARQASKKALEEMNRETQRISREQHLTHQAKVRKSFRTSDFLQYFNSKHGGKATSPIKDSDDEFMMSGALMSSDTEQVKHKDTPPTSPLGQTSFFKLPPGEIQVNALMNVEVDEELPTLEELKTQAEELSKNPELHKEAIPIISDIPAETTEKKFTKRKMRVILPLPTRHALDDSDDDLEIMDLKVTARAIFDQIPVNKAPEAQSMLNLRHLANLTSPSRSKPRAKGQMTMNELKVNLGEKARQQALRDREERMSEARARGVYIPTAEERERDLAELISIEKARESAFLLGKKEQAQAKTDGEDLNDGLDDSEDEEYDGDSDPEDYAHDSEADDEEELEDEEVDDEEVDDEEQSVKNDNPLFDNEAEDASDNEAEDVELDENLNSNTTRSKSPAPSIPDTPIFKKPSLLTRPRNRKVIVDDDDEDAEPSQPQQSASQTSPNVNPFGLGYNSPTLGLGLSQAFASTLMGEDSQETPLDTEQDSLAVLRQLPPGTVPEFDNVFYNDRLVPDSQSDAINKYTQRESAPMVTFGISQFASPSVDKSPSKMSDMAQLTQDVGFAEPRAPAGITLPGSTTDTMLLHTQETPVPKRRGKLRRKASMIAVLSDSENDLILDQEEEFEPTKDAFDVLFKNAKKRKDVEEFNKKTSMAKGMFEEQAEESEDEYQGLGGASDDDSDNEIDEDVAKMMDEGPVNLKEREIAAFHAEKERKDDEKNLERLYKDVTNGLLRKRRGGDLDDLDDSDDEILERRRRKQEEFARMRRALLTDEKIGKIAQNPKQQAFFRAIEDHDDADTMDFLDEAEPIDIHESQGESQQAETTAEQNTYPVPMLKRKASNILVDSSGKENRAPEELRKSSESSFKRPRLVDIREQLSFLTEDSAILDSQVLSDDDAGEDDYPLGISRTNTNLSMDSNGSRSSVVNRLVRASITEDDSSRPLAFQAANAKSSSSFKIPSLLRRATNLSTTSESSNATNNSSVSNDSSVRLGRSKKSNIHYQAYEAERRKTVEATELKRKAYLKKTVMASKGRAIMGLLKNSSGFE